ncbi:MAG: dihydrolipoamide acetyltransferase family protein [Clostridia bacterium]|nr:dihydrolipoamide acetyltransferase family protein [Clostridia bacterium]
MAQAVIMPRQGQSVESCIITKWHKKEGDIVKTGDLLFTYETDKATFDEEAKFDGTMLKILYNEDDDVPCLENVCIIGEKGEDISSFIKGGEKSANDIKEKAEEKINSIKEEINAVAVQVNETAEGGKIKISPRAKNLAQKLGIDYSQISATGPEGRITEKDIENYAASGVISLRQQAAPQQAAPIQEKPFTDEKLTNIRKAIAKAMYNSLQSTAQLTHTASFDATSIQNLRSAIKPLAEKGQIGNITLNDIIMYAVVRMLTRYRIFNAHMLDDKIRYFNNVNIAMAVDTERGLMVPVCFNAENLSLSELAQQLKKLSTACRQGSISPDLLSGGGFTVSNLGVYGVESFTPILNAPQTGILGVNTITTRVRQGKNGLETYPCMALSLTYDHRAADGGDASRFLRDLCNYLENFTTEAALAALI